MLDIDGCVGGVVWEIIFVCPGGQYILFTFSFCTSQSGVWSQL